MDQYNWNFSNVPDGFDNHVRKSVPLYDYMHDNLTNISKYFIRNNSDVIDIGTSTGSFIKSIYDLNIPRKVNLVGVDIEPNMIKECVSRYKDFPIKFLQEDALNISYSNASFVSLILVLQFMKIDDRIKLLNKIHSEIENNSAVCIVEKIRSNNIEMHDIYNDLYYDFKIKSGLSFEDVIEKNRSLRGVMKPITLGQNLSILENIGFNVDIIFKFNNFVGLIAIKEKLC